MFVYMYSTHVMALCDKQSKIEKATRGISGEKSRKDTASLVKVVSTIGTQASPQKGERNQVSGRISVPCWHVTPVAIAPWKPRSRS